MTTYTNTTDHKNVISMGQSGLVQRFYDGLCVYENIGYYCQQKYTTYIKVNLMVMVFSIDCLWEKSRNPAINSLGNLKYELWFPARHTLTARETTERPNHLHHRLCRTIWPPFRHSATNLHRANIGKSDLCPNVCAWDCHRAKISWVDGTYQP